MSDITKFFHLPKYCNSEANKEKVRRKTITLRGTLYVTNDNSIIQATLTITSAPEFLVFLP